MDTVLMTIVKVGLPAVAFILILKFVFVKIVKIPGLSPVVASI